jgi:hypothetical protein
VENESESRRKKKVAKKERKEGLWKLTPTGPTTRIYVY